ncbi:MAG: type II 3-dehydroquinate dehydratase [Gallionellaceae bacterium]
MKTSSANKASFAKNLLVLHGPNLNLLGTREPEIYGRVTLDEINNKLVNLAKSNGANLAYFQSNAESVLVECIQQARQDGTDFIIINPAAFTHTSVALRDALAAVGIPFIEIHLSNVFAREAFRRESFFSDIAVGIISGLGATGYELAVQYAIQYPVRS